MIKAVIYDLDDTLVDSMSLHEEAWEVPLKEYGHSLSEVPKSLLGQFVGRRIIDITDAFIDYFGIDAKERDDLYKKRLARYTELAEHSLKALPGAVAIVNLHKQEGRKLAVASSGTKGQIEVALKRLGIMDDFDVIVNGDDVKVGKPDPATYIVAVRKLGFRPDECVVLEDATVGIQAAKAAGCWCVAVRNPGIYTQDLSAADAIVNRIDEVRVDELAG